MGYVSNPTAMRTITSAEDFTPEQQALRQRAMEVGKEIVGEGCVLLKNDGLLPLKAAPVNVFGALSAQPYFGGRGSSCADNSRAVGLYTALSLEGFSCNPTLYNLYKNWVKKGRASNKPYPPEETMCRPKKASVLTTVMEVYAKPYIRELPVKYLTEEVMKEAAAFSDTAVVVLGRSGSEQHDMTPPELRLRAEERAMLDRVCAYFGKVLLLLNTAGIFELAFLKDYPSIRAVLSIGYVARTGMKAVAELVCGKKSPSGRLTDTFYYSVTEHPAYQNTGTYRYKDAPKRCFLLYKEDIYVGYRYTETFLSGEAYRQKVQFPFGYGLSYTDFTWSDYQLAQDREGVEVRLTVKNTGAYSGKDVVELFVRAPYTGKLEKADKVLAAFQKTDLLAPGESQRLVLRFPWYAIMSYSSERQGYVLEAGGYEAHLSLNAHTPAAVLPFSVEQELFYGRDNVTGAKIRNRFSPYEGSFKRLCRRDGANALPEAPRAEEYNAPGAVKEYLKDQIRKTGAQAAVQGKNHGLLLADLAGKDWDDPLWERFLDQFTIEEMMELIVYGGYQTRGNPRLGIPETIASDGPAGIHDSVTARSGISYPSGTTIASTWNPELARAYGEAVGMEAGFMHVQEWYGPSMNTHRSPFGGRCFEYYSEDPLLSGKMAAAAVRGVQSKGLACHIKHFALNEEDKHRMNVHTWCSEQAIREIYCKPFEYAVKEGGAVGVMSGLNCVGGDWCGESRPLLTGLLREEWGFHGCIVTDYAAGKYQRTSTGVPAGNDLWLCPMGNGKYRRMLQKAWQADPEGLLPAMRHSVKSICYMVLHTNAGIPGGIKSV